MSVFRKLALQNGVAVLREGPPGETGQVIKAVDLKRVEKQEKAIARFNTSSETIKRRTWRTALQKLTNDGDDLVRVLYELAMGSASQVLLPDGRVSEPVIPTPEVRRAAAADLLDRLHGKAVAQTEVMRASQEAEDHAQYSALTDEQLKEVLRNTAWVIAEQKRRELSEGDGEE